MKSIDPYFDSPTNELTENLEFDDKALRSRRLNFLLSGSGGALAAHSIVSLFVSGWFVPLSAVIGGLIGVKFIAPILHAFDDILRSYQLRRDMGIETTKNQGNDEMVEVSLPTIDTYFSEELGNRDRTRIICEKFLVNTILHGNMDDLGE